MTRRSLIYSALLLIALLGVFPAAQAATVAELFAAGRAAVGEQRWDDARAAFGEVLLAEPANGPANFGMGQTLMQLGRQAEAAPHYAAAAEAGFWLPYARFRQACALASMGKKEEAFYALAQAVEAGFRDVDALAGNAELAELRDDPRFEATVKMVERKAKPCEHDLRYRAFDFWIGEWDVYSPAGQQVGINSIEPLLSSCMLLENWTSGSGTSGKSMNYLDPATGRWHQKWVDESGQIIDYEGEFKSGAMRFEGRLTDGAGKISLSRMTFTPQTGGSVKQFIENSTDGGGTWTVWFNGIYVPRGQPFPGSGN